MRGGPPPHSRLVLFLDQAPVPQQVPDDHATCLELVLQLGKHVLHQVSGKARLEWVDQIRSQLWVCSYTGYSTPNFPVLLVLPPSRRNACMRHAHCCISPSATSTLIERPQLTFCLCLVFRCASRLWSLVASYANHPPYSPLLTWLLDILSAEQFPVPL